MTPIRAPRVLIVGNFLSRWGASRGVCEELAQHLQASDFFVLTTSRRRNRLARLANMLSTCWRRRAQFDVAQIDVYSGLSFLWAEAVAALLRFLRKPYMLTLHGGNLPSFARRCPRRVRALLNSAQAVTAPSRYLVHEMRQYRSDLRLLPNGLDLQKYPFRLRREPQPLLIWIRAFHRVYNPVLAVRALALALPSFPGLRLTMIGPDKGDGSLQMVEECAARLGVRDRLGIHPAVPKSEVPARLKGADIFLNTARIDNSPMSVLEAMACGLCVVSTRVGGIPYSLTDMSDALLVPDDDPAAMAEAILRVLQDHSLAKRLSSNSRRVTEQFDWKVILPRWQQALRVASTRADLLASLEDNDVVLSSSRS